ncbi:uncharacterized protein LOC113514760 isoform X3 [Galleria mellonella]|uniref:Uncharacterized protein LOC113514760 isoform X3 n=1 Tax=Galleria mellonella TaxID=7137 RepID=A0ABM3MQS7_GALME|nr:uncharacterized protein LOC113514760 isoform X3 [Galleria mellonella]
MYSILLCYIFTVSLYIYVNAFNLPNDNTKIIIDNDAGGDDAMAIFLALLYQKHFNGPEVVALTTVRGNTAEHNVYTNNQRILKLINRQDVPIYRGINNSLFPTFGERNYYGTDGLGDTGESLIDPVPAQPQDAVTALIELSKKHEGNLIIVTTGPVTNIAMAIVLDPAFLGQLKHLYIAAGHIYSDIHPNAEFNAMADAEAYFMITQRSSPDKVTLIPFSQIRIHLNFTKEWRQDVLGAINTDIIKAQNKFEQVSMKKNVRWQALDPASVAIVVRPDLVKEYKYSRNDINLCGENRGLNNNDLVNKEEANVRLVYSVKEDEYKEFLLDVFSKQ